MKSQWNETQAAKIATDDLAACAYATSLLNGEGHLLTHQGFCTVSVKTIAADFFGRDLEVININRPDADFGKLESTDFDELRLAESKMLAGFDSLTDLELANQLRNQHTKQTSSTPSVNAVLHASIPAKFVIQSHADPVIALTNNLKGEAIIAEVYPDCLVLPFTAPRSQLSKQLNAALQKNEISKLKGIIIHHLGLLTFADSSRDAYENHCELVSRARDYIATKASEKIPFTANTSELTAGARPDLLQLATIRKAVSTLSLIHI